MVTNLTEIARPKTPQTYCKLSILPTCCNLSTSCNKLVNFIKLQQVRIVKIRIVAICHLQTCYNLLKQLAESLLITSLDNQFATSLLTICDRLVLNKRSQAMRMHPDIGLCNKLLQDVKRLVATFVGVWLCRTGIKERYIRAWKIGI